MVPFEQNAMPGNPLVPDHEQKSLSLTPKQKAWSNFQIVAGSLLGLGSACCVVEEIIWFCTGRIKELGGQVAATLFFVGLVVGSFLIVRNEWSKRRALREARQEQLVLRHAKTEPNNSTTISSISLNCSMSLAESIEVANRLTKRGVCTVDVSDSGDMLYCFPSLGKKNIPQLGTDTLAKQINQMSEPE